MTDVTHPWFLFCYGTVVMLPADETKDYKELSECAIELMKEWPVIPGTLLVARRLVFFAYNFSGTNLGDFHTVRLQGEVPGALVHSGHPTIITYVCPEEFGSTDKYAIGLFGRSKRNADATDPQLIYSHNVKGDDV